MVCPIFQAKRSHRVQPPIPPRTKGSLRSHCASSYTSFDSDPRLHALHIGIFLVSIPIVTLVIELRAVARICWCLAPTLFCRQESDLGFNVWWVGRSHFRCLVERSASLAASGGI